MSYELVHWNAIKKQVQEDISKGNGSHNQYFSQLKFSYLWHIKVQTNYLSLLMMHIQVISGLAIIVIWFTNVHLLAKLNCLV